MIIEYNFQRFVLQSEQSIKSAIELLNRSKERVVFCLSEGRLEGVLTNGDLLRWISQQNMADLNTAVSEAMNKHYFSANENTESTELAKLLDKTNYVPIVKADNKLVGVARRRKYKEFLEIGNFKISEDHPSFVIAEIGNNHNGSLKAAKALVDLAIESGADCAKFQMRNMKALYQSADASGDDGENLGTQYTLDLLNKFQLTDDELFKVFDYCKDKGILPLCTPWDLLSLEKLEAYGMPAYKVASADMTNHDFLRAVAKTGKPMIISTGMSTHQEIEETVRVLQEVGAQYVLLHCNSTYPAPFSDVHLNYLPKLKETGKCVVGYSGHERGIEVPIAAVALGAKVIEKHFTTDRSLEGNDHKVSLLPQEFKQMIISIRNIEQAMGVGSDRFLSQGEMMNRVNLAKSLIATMDIPKGKIIEASMLDAKSPGKGLQPNFKSQLLGRPAKREMRKGDFFYPSDLEGASVQASDYKFEWDWGVPVRYHDFEKLINECPNLKLVEFHLSYKDLEVDFSKYFTKPNYNYKLIVHSPELFAGDHIMDLCSEDPEYLKHSIHELQRTIDVTRKLTEFFPDSKTIPLIVNVGGFTTNGPLNKENRKKYYDKLANSLKKVNSDGVEILPQTMPPFPWHMGGQQFHNLFLDADEIVDFCRDHNFRICYDVSHSKLACNHFDWSFFEFSQKVLPYTAHLHLADAEGKDGEGMQIGEGELDFKLLFQQMVKENKEYTFIPEIWQGHENRGEGFWKALSLLENKWGELNV